MYFRPYPLLTLFAIPMLAALIALGVWQSQRAGWKWDLVASLDQQLAAPPQTIEQACQAGLAAGQIVVPLTGQGPELRIFGQRADGAPGWKRFQAGEICGRQILIQTGFEALQIGGPGGRLPTPPPAPADRFIIQPWPEKPFMSGENSPEPNEWYWFDAPAFATALGQPALDAVHIAVPLDGKPDFLVRTPPETHIGYAVTWFGMAIAFVVIYGLFHMRAGRLRFGKAPDQTNSKAGE